MQTAVVLATCVAPAVGVGNRCWRSGCQASTRVDKHVVIKVHALHSSGGGQHSMCVTAATMLLPLQHSSTTVCVHVCMLGLAVEVHAAAQARLQSGSIVHLTKSCSSSRAFASSCTVLLAPPARCLNLSSF